MTAKRRAVSAAERTTDPWRNRIVGQGDEAPDQLLANPSNWRIHPTAQREALAAVLDDVGWVQRVIVNRTTQHVVDGHLRVALALSRDEPTIPVNYVELDEREEALVLAALDPIAAMAATDKDKLRELLEQAQVTDEALRDQLNDVAGMTAALTEGETDPDAVPDERATEIERGDLFALGDHRLLCGDSTNADDVARVMGGAKSALLLTDPPYGISVVGSTGKIGGSVLAKNQAYQPVHGDDKPFDPVHLFTMSAVAVVWGANYFPLDLPRPGQWIVWDKGRPEGTTFSDCELAWTSRTGVAVKKYSCIWNGMTREGESGLRVHPTQKPIKLISDVMADFSDEGDPVSDVYCGSGTTIIAAEQLSRRCYAIEIEPSYCQVIIDRWEAFTGEKAKKVQP